MSEELFFFLLLCFWHFRLEEEDEEKRRVSAGSHTTTTTTEVLKLHTAFRETFTNSTVSVQTIKSNVEEKKLDFVFCVSSFLTQQLRHSQIHEPSSKVSLHKIIFMKALNHFCLLKTDFLPVHFSTKSFFSSQKTKHSCILEKTGSSAEIIIIYVFCSHLLVVKEVKRTLKKGIFGTINS